MNEPKPFASLSPTLLARKGSARPAMRPQAATLTHFPDAAAANPHDDLGWNDMGHDHHDLLQSHAPAHGHAHPRGYAHIDAPHIQVPSPTAIHAPLIRHEAIANAPSPAEVIAINDVEVPHEAPLPAVVQQQAEVAARVAKPAAQPEPVAREAMPRRRSALDEGRRAAFTLRLDAERHLKLRLACTIAGRSAQMLVTDALDRLIADLPDVATLAAQVRQSR